MPSLRDTIRTTLVNDVTLAGILTGGIYDADQLDREGIEQSTIRDSQLRIKPFAVLRWRASNPFGPEVLPAEERFVEIYFYEDSGTAGIEAAKTRTKTLLHRKYFTATGTGIVFVTWAGDLGEIPPGEAGRELGNSSADRSRYAVILTRR
jgi:hypothetical protein